MRKPVQRALRQLGSMVRHCAATGVVLGLLVAALVMCTCGEAEVRGKAMTVYNIDTIRNVVNAPAGTLVLFLGTSDSVPPEWEVCKGQAIEARDDDVLFGGEEGGRKEPATAPNWTRVLVMGGVSGRGSGADERLHWARIVGRRQAFSGPWHELLVLVRVK